MRKRRKNHKAQIKKWTMRHTHAINTLSRFNIVTMENFIKSTNVSGRCMSRNAVLDMRDLNYIRINTVEYKNELIEVVQLGSKSIRSIRNISNNIANHIYNSSSDFHDLEHSNFIFSIFSVEDIQQFYRSEKELIDNGADSSPTDGAFIYNENEKIYVETVTQHYTKKQKEMHRIYAEREGGTYIENCVRIPKKIN